MSKCYIKFGSINNKLFLPFLLAVSEIAYILFNKYYPVHEVNLILHVYSMAFGEMSIKFLPCILKISDKGESAIKRQIIKKKSCKHYTILVLLYFFTLNINTFVDVFDTKVLGKPLIISGSNLFYSYDLIILGIEMILMIFVSNWLLKYKYYKHHIISTIVFVIFGIISELCLGTYFQNNGFFFLSKFIRLLGALLDGTYICFQKYMMEKFYYPYWNIAFVPGVIMFITGSSMLIAVLSLKDSNNEFASAFYLYFKVKEGLGLAILKVVIDLTMHLIMCPLTILNIYYFSPNFILIIFQISAIAKIIMNNSAEKLYCIAFFIIQFFSLMVHLEILELNFCGLNRHTKTNINFRSMNELISEERESITDENSIEIEKGYSDVETNDEKMVELKEEDFEPMNE